MTTTTQEAVQKRLTEIRVQSAIAEFGHECKRIVRTDIPALLDLVTALLEEREEGNKQFVPGDHERWGAYAEAESKADTALRRFAGEE